jgi:[acyl-carrier-protein] S-malonyltransferase
MAAGLMVQAWVFPGQGSQAVGMGKALSDAFPVAREVFQEVDDALGQRLSRIMWEGPDSDLTLTENAQPALLAVSLAALRVIEGETGKRIEAFARYAAGHSLGEYSALTAARSLRLADAARLVKIRGEAMQRAVPPGAGAMLALLGADLAVAQEIAAEAAGKEVCVVANDNGGGQIVLSGHAGAIARAAEIAPGKGVKRAIPLQVSAPLHSPLLAPAADAMHDALEKIDIAVPSVTVIANVTAQPVSAPDDIRRLLVEQVTGMVRWRESVETLTALGVDRYVELGCGKVVSGLIKRIARDATAISGGTPEELETIMKSL